MEEMCGLGFIGCIGFVGFIGFFAEGLGFGVYRVRGLGSKVWAALGNLAGGMGMSRACREMKALGVPEQVEQWRVTWRRKCEMKWNEARLHSGWVI